VNERFESTVVTHGQIVGIGEQRGRLARLEKLDESGSRHWRGRSVLE